MSWPIGTMLEHCKAFGWGPGYRRGVVCPAPPDSGHTSEHRGFFVRWTAGGTSVFSNDSRLRVIEVIEAMGELATDDA